MEDLFLNNTNTHTPPVPAASTSSWHDDTHDLCLQFDSTHSSLVDELIQPSDVFTHFPHIHLYGQPLIASNDDLPCISPLMALFLSENSTSDSISSTVPPQHVFALSDITDESSSSSTVTTDFNSDVEYQHERLGSKKRRTNYRHPEKAAKLKAAVQALIMQNQEHGDIRMVSRIFNIPYNTLRDNFLRLTNGHVRGSKRPYVRKKKACLNSIPVESASSVENGVSTNTI